MGKTIFKFELTPDKHNYDLPVGAEILSVQSQNDTVQMWALVDPKAETETRIIHVFGTGHAIHDDLVGKLKFIDTFQLRGGRLVFHAFELVK